MGAVPIKDGEYGNKETLEAVEAGVEFGNALDQCFADGDYDLIDDSLKMATVIPKLIDGIKGGDLVLTEVFEFDEAEWAQVREVVTKFDFREDAKEAIAEKAMAWTLATVDLVQAIREAKK